MNFLPLNRLKTYSLHLTLLVLAFQMSYAQNNGPTAPEAMSFEPVDASDMVSLISGDMSYVLPLLNVPSPEGGYPITLAYHGGIGYDLESSWVGLGWNINPGAINRSVNGYPDDWKDAIVRNRNFYDYTSETVDIGVGIGVSDELDLDISFSYSWDSNGSKSGVVSLGIGSEDGWSAAASIGYSNRNGIIGGVSGGYKHESGVGISGGVSTSGASIGASYSFSDKNGIENGSSIGISLSSNGGFSGTFSTNGIGSIGFSSNNSTSGDATETSFGARIPIFPGVTLKFGYKKVRYENDETYVNHVYGPLYFKEFDNLPTDKKRGGDSSYGNTIRTEHNRDYFMDAYSELLPQQELDLVAYKDIFEKEQNKYTLPSYDYYHVNAQGLSGLMQPRLLENGLLIPEPSNIEYDLVDGRYHGVVLQGGILVPPSFHVGKYAENCLEDFLKTSFTGGKYEEYIKKSAVVNWHYDSAHKFRNTFGQANSNINFYFENSFPSSLIVNAPNLVNTTNATSVSQYLSGSYSRIMARKQNSNFVETFTNEQIINSAGTVLEAVNANQIYNRAGDPGYMASGIGAYKVTTPDGKTYHYSRPVYQFEEFHRQLKNHPYDGQFDESLFYHEKRKIQPYATHWLLTAVTGPDYVKSDINRHYPDKGDYGYWVRFDYGTWTDGYAWRLPYNDYNDLSLNNTDKLSIKQYSWGRKQITYLNKVVTRTHSALFIKSLKEDGISKDIGAGGFPSYENDDRVYYPKQNTLKLDEIILVKYEDDVTNFSNQRHTLTTPSQSPNTTINVPWISMNPLQYQINKQNDILDSGDLVINSSTGNFQIYDKALKVIKFDQSYRLAKNSANSSSSTKGKLTLDSLGFLGKNGVEYMPNYAFSYLSEDISYQECLDAGDCVKDPWGYYAQDPTIWSMNQVTVPTGAKINIEYEKDAYWTEAFARRYWTDFLKFRIRDDHANNKFYIDIKNEDGYTDIDVQVQNFYDYFTQGETAAIELWISSHSRGHCSWTNWQPSTRRERIGIKSKNLTVESVSSTQVILSGNFSDMDRHNHDGGGVEGLYNDRTDRWYSYVGGSNSNLNRHAPRGDYGEDPGSSDCRYHHHKMYYSLVANKVPGTGTGGGIRVKSLTSTDESNNVYKSKYSYDFPVKGGTSGITSFAPVKGVKYVAYQAELPSPNVTYEYVTVEDVGTQNQSLGKTQYHFDVLKPVGDIFAKSLDVGNHFKVTVSEADIDRNRKTKGNKVHFEDNTAMIGSLLDLSVFNPLGHLMSKKINTYKPLEELLNSDKGSLQESFQSLKSVYQYDYEMVKFKMKLDAYFVNYSQTFNCNFDSRLTLKNRYLNITSKVKFPIYQELAESWENNKYQKTTSYNPDPKTGAFLNTRTTLGDGTMIENIKVPAYTKYREMGSKLDRITNKNMLTQEAMSITKIGSRTLNASLTTWNPYWSYRNELGNQSAISSEKPVWRKHKTFVWKDDVNPSTGTYATTISPTSNYFNWGTGTPTSNKWQNVSEITKYTHWSSPLEMRDINNNFTASKMADNFSKVIATGNARETELFYSGAEYNPSGNYTEGALLGANFRSQDAAHTGRWSLKTRSSSNKLFEINTSVSSDLTTNSIRPGNYRVSYWINDPQTTGIASSRSHLMVNGAEVSVSETETAGCWKQLNYTISIPDTSTTVNIYVKNDNPNVHYDDFRMHPIYASMSSYVYNQDTDELIAILGANNMASVFCYDKAGRLCTSYAEVVNHGADIGGFKIASKNKYKYKGLQTNTTDCECRIDDCSQIDNDNDGILNTKDNCPDNYNPDQADVDNDGLGDACDLLNNDDIDNDGVLNSHDNCPNDYNPDQADVDNDGLGDVCDSVNNEPLKILSVDVICSYGYGEVFEANVTGGSGNYKYEWSWLINYEENLYTSFIEGNGNQSMLVGFALVKCDSDNNRFNRIRQSRVKVTDQVTAEVVHLLDRGVMFSGCRFYIDENNWDDYGMTKCLNNCSNSDYRFKIYTKDPNMAGNFKYEYLYYNPITKTNSNWIDVTASNGEFCLQFFNTEWSHCPSGYIKSVKFGTRITNLSTGQVSGASWPAHHAYMGCSDVSPRRQYSVPPNYVDKEKDYINEDTIIEIDSEGEVISVRSINGENLKD